MVLFANLKAMELVQFRGLQICDTDTTQTDDGKLHETGYKAYGDKRIHTRRMVVRIRGEIGARSAESFGNDGRALLCLGPAVSPSQRDFRVGPIRSV